MNRAISILINTKIIRYTLLFIFAFTSLALTQGIFSKSVDAYQHGYLIDDMIFLDAKSMSASQIQSFLNSKSGVLKSRSFKLDCDAEGIGQAAKQLYIKAGAPCGSTISAARIIYYSAQVYGVNPKVIIATLQKEQSLITDSSPSTRAIRQAMGYACPTSGVCDSSSSFFWQIDNGTWVLRFHFERARKNNNWWYTSSSWTCGTKKTNYYSPNLYPRQNVKFYDPYSKVNYVTVYIKNAATSAFYCYTPHVFNNHSNSPHPNDAKSPRCYSMHPASGSKGRCYTGSYNFVKAFESWFGSTTNSFRSLANPRIMQIKSSTQKVNLITKERFGPVLSPGAQTYFVDMILIDGSWHARTEYDYNNNNYVGIPTKDIGDIPTNNITPRWISVDNKTNKINPLKRVNVQPVSGQSAGKILSEITVSGVKYYRTEYDHNAGRPHFIKASDTTEFKLYNFTNPRVLATKTSVAKIDAFSNNTVSTTPAGTLLTFNKKVMLGGAQYMQAVADNGSNNLYKYSDFSEIGDSTNSNFVSLDVPRWMQLRVDTKKVEVSLPSQTFGPTLSAGTQAYFIDKVMIDGVWYARTAYDHAGRNMHVIPAADLENIPIVPITSKWMSVVSPTQKITPTTSDKFENIPNLVAAEFVDKITVANKEYYRTAYEKRANRLRFIPADALEEFRFFDFIKPRQMTTKTNTAKINVQTGEVVSSVPMNTTMAFNRRITIGNVLYAQAETDNGTIFAIRSSALRDK